ncbi:MAG: type VI secretion system baseplate subunit TssK [Rhodothermia bacterium]|nr:type VI secretion system baseplate subunit TssK [Rhodothermia bacterium]
MSRDNRRVLWYEGMTLDPHHFQQWDRYHGNALNARIRSVRQHDWGLTTLEIDRDRLANGEFSLISCSGVLSGGLDFAIPEDADPPPIRNIADHFPPNSDHVSVFLSVPAARSDGINVDLHAADSMRPATIVSRTATVTDENTGSDERAIQVGQANFQLRFGTESSEAFTNHQIAVIRRGAGGFFALDDRFIPTCLSIEASHRLLGISRRLLELAVAKSSSLSERKMDSTGQRQLTPSDITALGLLASVNAHIPLLNHYHAMKSGHPE